MVAFSDDNLSEKVKENKNLWRIDSGVISFGSLGIDCYQYPNFCWKQIRTDKCSPFRSGWRRTVPNPRFVHRYCLPAVCAGVSRSWTSCSRWVFGSVVRRWGRANGAPIWVYCPIVLWKNWKMTRLRLRISLCIRIPSQHNACDQIDWTFITPTVGVSSSNTTGHFDDRRNPSVIWFLFA